MSKFYFKILNVNETITENGKTSVVNLAFIQSPDQTYHHTTFGMNITGNQEELDFYISNAGKVVELPYNINNFTVL